MFKVCLHSDQKRRRVCSTTAAISTWHSIEVKTLFYDEYDGVVGVAQDYSSFRSRRNAHDRHAWFAKPCEACWEKFSSLKNTVNKL